MEELAAGQAQQTRTLTSNENPQQLQVPSGEAHSTETTPDLKAHAIIDRLNGTVGLGVQLEHSRIVGGETSYKSEGQGSEEIVPVLSKQVGLCWAGGEVNVTSDGLKAKPAISGSGMPAELLCSEGTTQPFASLVGVESGGESLITLAAALPQKCSKLQLPHFACSDLKPEKHCAHGDATTPLVCSGANTQMSNDNNSALSAVELRLGILEKTVLQLAAEQREAVAELSTAIHQVLSSVSPGHSRLIAGAGATGSASAGAGGEAGLRQKGTQSPGSAGQTPVSQRSSVQHIRPLPPLSSRTSSSESSTAVDGLCKT